MADKTFDYTLPIPMMRESKLCLQRCQSLLEEARTKCHDRRQSLKLPGHPKTVIEMNNFD